MSQTKDNLNQQIHLGRRKKLRARFLDNGLDTFNEYEVLEFALGFCIPRQDTNPAAHSLIDHFGSLQAVIDAKPADLQKAFGIGAQSGVFLHFLKQFSSYLMKQTVNNAVIKTPEQAIKYLAPLLRTYTVEKFVIVCLGSSGKVKKVYHVTNHELDMVHVNMREIVSLVTATKTAQVVMAHNHLNDDPQPSVADMQLTRRLALTLQNLGIKFLDHIIIAGDQDYSFHCSGLLDTLKSNTTHK